LEAFFYSNEGNEPIHIYAEKVDMECKFWILIEEVEIKEAFVHNITPAGRKEIEKQYKNGKLTKNQYYGFIGESSRGLSEITLGNNSRGTIQGNEQVNAESLRETKTELSSLAEERAEEVKKTVDTLKKAMPLAPIMMK
jgi:hypothetical protein